LRIGRALVMIPQLARLSITLSAIGSAVGSGRGFALVKASSPASRWRDVLIDNDMIQSDSRDVLISPIKASI
jgi:hypothetical protein